MLSADLPERHEPWGWFWSCVLRMDCSRSTCWLWTGAKHDHGYGLVDRRLPDGSRVRDYAHRISFRLLVGDPPAGMHLDHLCRTPACVNPAHLEPVTPRENILRGVSPSASQARQTHCLRGHELNEANVYRRPDNVNARACRICTRIRDKAKRCRRGAAAV